MSEKHIKGRKKSSPLEISGKWGNSDLDSDGDYEKLINKFKQENSKKQKRNFTKSNSALQRTHNVKNKRNTHKLLSNKTLTKKVPIASLTQHNDLEIESQRQSYDDSSETDRDNNSPLRKHSRKKFKRITKIATKNSNSDFSIQQSNSFEDNSNDAVHLNKKNSGDSPVVSEKANIFHSNVDRPLRSSSDLNYEEIIKLKCSIPCYAVLQRNPMIDREVYSLNSENSSSNVLSNSCLDEDNDCVILHERINSSHQNSEGIYPINIQGLEKISSEQNNETQTGEITYALLRSNSKCSTPKVQEKHTHKSKIIDSSNNLLITSKPQSSMENKEISFDAEDCIILSGTAKPGHNEIISINNDEKRICQAFSDETKTSEKAVENLPFNVKIVSVTSLENNTSTATEDVLNMIKPEESKFSNAENKSKTYSSSVSEMQDSDIEIIDLDPIISNEKSMNERQNSSYMICKEIKDNTLQLNCIENHSENQDECIILDDEDFCPYKTTSNLEPMSLVRENSREDLKHDPKCSSNEHNEVSSDSTYSSKNKDSISIFELLNKIDFNYINKIINQTAIDGCENKNDSTKIVSIDESITPDKKVNTFSDRNLKTLQNDTNCTKKDNSENIVKNTYSRYNETHCNTYAFQNLKNQIDVSNYNADKICNSGMHINHNLIVKNPSERLTIPYIEESYTSNAVGSRKYVDEKSSINKPSLTSGENERMNFTYVQSKNYRLPNEKRKLEIDNDSPSDELDILAAKSVCDLGELANATAMPLLELFKREYNRYIEIKSTEQSFTAGLKLVEENQVKILMHLSSSIKNLMKHDSCFYEVAKTHTFPEKESKADFENCFKKGCEVIDDQKRFLNRTSCSIYQGTNQDNTVPANRKTKEVQSYYASCDQECTFGKTEADVPFP
ncbi:MYND-type domain-containing protein [Caerostris extrusa]|uniref:MYND-type domain-containing protein n=1 Tax=Caerostris extrusa TaxID=172846 RepID=A0AAV4V3V2_CAEEX|nr:MYND-type domain-containing protein [Caerostris extrusa]